MACFFPSFGWYSKHINPETGKRPLVFNFAEAYSPKRVPLPCGRCPGCLKARASSWAVRITHERRMHSASAFVTLTYSPANLPVRASLVKSDLQKFMKRLRLTRPSGLRFFACGEYGETTSRPHYHILLLNTDFPDKRYWKKGVGGYPLYVSAELGSLWTLGDHYIGEVSIASALYVAQYITKPSVTPPGVEPPFQVMSRRPGLGYTWWQRYGKESYYHDDCVIEGKKRSLPRYYDEKQKLVDKSQMDALKIARRRAQLTPAMRAENQPMRRRQREEFALATLRQQRRRDPV